MTVGRADQRPRRLDPVARPCSSAAPAVRKIEVKSLSRQEATIDIQYVGHAGPAEGQSRGDEARPRGRRPHLAPRAFRRRQGRDAAMTRLGLNAPNLITLARLMSVPLMIWLIVSERFGAAFWVFVGAGVCDALDGFIAKRFDCARGSARCSTRSPTRRCCRASSSRSASPRRVAGLAGDPRRVSRRDDHRRLYADPGDRAAPRQFDPLYISKINTPMQIALVAFVLAGSASGSETGRSRRSSSGWPR